MNWTNRKQIKQLEERIQMGRDLLEFLPKAEDDTTETKSARDFLLQEVGICETLVALAQTTC